jgi:hypothetical protein
MKRILGAALLVLIPFTSFAGTKACEKLAADTATARMEKSNGDDCFVRFVQPGKADANLINVGIACDHTGSTLYQIKTEPKTNGCRIVSVRSKSLDRDL